MLRALDARHLQHVCTAGVAGSLFVVVASRAGVIWWVSLLPFQGNFAGRQEEGILKMGSAQPSLYCFGAAGIMVVSSVSSWQRSRHRNCSSIVHRELPVAPRLVASASGLTALEPPEQDLLPRTVATIGNMEMNTTLKFGKYYICYLFLILY